MTILFIIFVALLLPYRFIIRRANRQLMFLQQYNASRVSSDKASIIIAARNEEANIGQCLESLLDQDFPQDQMEIIVVDDQSVDQTAAIVRSYANRGVRLISLGKYEAFGKKAAIAKGIAAAAHPIIFTTDADCHFAPRWLNTMLLFREDMDAVFVAAPVQFRKEKTLLDRFQSLDFMALQGITAAGVSGKYLNMCNGANLLYTKEAFLAVNGFEGIDHIASGDDMLMMEKIDKAFPGGVAYCFSKDAMVVTEPAASWSAFIQQRIRWSSKAKNYTSFLIKATLLLVYLVNAAVVFLLLAGLFDLQLLKYGLLLTAMKTMMELPFMIRIARFFNKSTLIAWFIPFQPLHAFYTVVAGTFGLFSKYRWKGREVR
jgi:biofilm PGA synthesis N-glycosyltransferase PgaC